MNSWNSWEGNCLLNIFYERDIKEMVGWKLQEDESFHNSSWSSIVFAFVITSGNFYSLWQEGIGYQSIN